MARGGSRRSLLALIVAANVAVLSVSLVGLASTPLTVTWPDDVREGVVLGLAIGVTIAVQTLLMRRLLAPLGALWRHMQDVDPLSPGRPVDIRARSREVADLVEAFDAMLGRLEQERRGSARRAQAAQDAERRWLSLELHDQIGQDLTALLLSIDVARRVDGEPRDAALEAALATAQDCLERVRAIVGRLRPAGLDELGLVSALVHLCDRVAGAGDLRVDRHFDEDVPELTPDAQLGVYRIAQEALTNVLRHSGAASASLTLAPLAGGVRLTVADDGTGMDTPATGGDESGSGVRGMRERALLLGASLRVGPRHPRGTEVTLDVPATEAVAPMPPTPSAATG